jgi:hypothetical protein
LKNIIGFILLSLIFFNQGSGQIEKSQDTLRYSRFSIFGNIGFIGTISVTNNEENADLNVSFLPGLQASIIIGFNEKHYIISKYYNINTLNTFGIEQPKANLLDYLCNYSILYGYGLINENKTIFISGVGLSYGNGLYRGKKTGTGGTFSVWPSFDYEKFEYFGVPILLSFTKTKNSYFGAGLDLYINIHKHPDLGIMIHFDFGYIRKKNKR